MTKEELERAAEVGYDEYHPGTANRGPFFIDIARHSGYKRGYSDGHAARATEGIATEDAIEAIHELGEDDFRSVIAELTRRRPGQADRAKRVAELVATVRHFRFIADPDKLEIAELDDALNELATLLESTE